MKPTTRHIQLSSKTEVFFSPGGKEPISLHPVFQKAANKRHTYLIGCVGGVERIWVSAPPEERSWSRTKQPIYLAEKGRLNTEHNLPDFIPVTAISQFFAFGKIKISFGTFTEN
ncbi:hypothetical protein TNCT_630451 [Trichonephila clavata]|uniref:Uncharacterized protein n=1 Tax=Trichonephila clavata TaxID=2740835 RepID=A0A8X6J808_TRICU|nr:hypothetical protein TNCT_630451 [Trichonephila clavata]